MKIGIISDTHDNLNSLNRAIEIFKKNKIDTILHGGDFISPFVLRALEGSFKKLIGVFGNNDGDKLRLNDLATKMGWELHLPPYPFELSGKKILMLHEPLILEAATKSGLYDIIIYGHTHKNDIRKENSTLIINSGEAGGWLTGKASIVILDMDKMKEELLFF
ncbi:MAG TPA: metallophosphoesterase [Nitrospinota bacterium]|nr:metallophosphoesterase [Nitrospinota bacterium]